MPRLSFVSTVQGADSIELVEPIITIGRELNNVVCIEDPNISKHHTLLIAEDNSYKIVDLHSVNGTWVNGARITSAKLKDGDAVRIGYLELKYENPVAAPAPVLAPVPPPPSAGPAGPGRPRLGLAGKPLAPVGPATPVAPVAEATPPPAPIKEEKRSMIRLPADKKASTPQPVATPPPLPPAVPAPATPTGPEGPRLKPMFRRPEPAPASEPPAVEDQAPAPEPPAPAAPKKLGGPPAGGPPRLKFRRE
jgi:hypothetical protein